MMARTRRHAWLKSPLTWLASAGLLIGAALAGGAAPALGTSGGGALTAGVAADTGWTVGELRPDGLRIVPSGHADASAVLDPSQFEEPKVRNAYWIATQIHETLNQLCCWCGVTFAGQIQAAVDAAWAPSAA